MTLYDIFHLFHDSVIFAADVKVSFDSYRNSMVATCNQKTIITTNPGVSACLYGCVHAGFKAC